MPTIRNALVIDTDDLDVVQVQKLRVGVDALLADLFGAAVHSDAVLGWTPTAAKELLMRLIQANRPVQAKVIVEEAKAGGMCDREKVYELGEFPSDRSLKGFTKPVTRIVKKLQEEGLLAQDAADPMKPIYDPANPSFQRARGFGMPSSLAPLFATLVSSES